jgi:hypothetical protein
LSLGNCDSVLCRGVPLGIKGTEKAKELADETASSLITTKTN